MSTQPDVVAIVTAQFARGESLENVLTRLRADGHGMAESVAILADAQGLELDEAKRLVVLSDTWLDHRDAYDSVEASFWDSLEQHGHQQEDGSFRINASDL